MTTPYRHPSIKEQWGLAPDPNGDHHVTTSQGHRLTRTVTAVGHEGDSSQPGFPIYHRRIANPFPLMSIATGACLLHLGRILIRNRGISNPAIFLVVALPLGMVGNFVACMFAFAEGSTWLATTAGTLAGTLGGSAFNFLPWSGVQASYVLGTPNQLAGLEEYYKAFGILYFVSLAPLFIVFLASFRTSGPVTGGILQIVVALGCLGGAYIDGVPHHTLLKTAGAFFIATGVALSYSALAVMLAEEGLRILPVFPMPRVD